MGSAQGLSSSVSQGHRVRTFAGAGGVLLEAQVWGDHDRPPVVLAHGGGQRRLAWRATGERLADAGFHAIAFDLRGHGASSWSSDYSLDAYRADVVAISEQVGSRPALVGASLGGTSCLLAEGETPGRLGWALVLVDIAPRVEHDGVERIMNFMEAHLDGFDDADHAARAVATYLPHRAPRGGDGLDAYLCERDGRLRWHWDPDFLRQARVNHLRPTTRARTMDAARQVEVQTLVVRGTRSDVLSDEGVSELCATIPRSESLDVSGATHTVAGDDNDAFASGVVAFLSRAVTEADGP